jgi:hypothetical protein
VTINGYNPTTNGFIIDRNAWHPDFTYELLEQTICEVFKQGYCNEYDKVDVTIHTITPLIH